MLQTKTPLERYTEACNYPGQFDEARVEAELQRYLQVIGVKRKIVRLRAGWTLAEHPSLLRYVQAVLVRLPKSKAARDALAALAARDALGARDALDALAAQALHRFTGWCIQAGWGWWWRFELSWLATTWFGAKQLKNEKVQEWAQPIFEAYIAGAWILHWTEESLYWVAKPKVFVEIVNSRRRLHNATGPALESDVENLYFWHGVMVPAFVVTKPEWITLKHIQAGQNAEVRRVMIERYGQDRFVLDAKAKTLDACGENELLAIDLPEDPDKKLVALKLRCPSTSAVYIVRVPPKMKKVKEALAWSFSLESAKDYVLEKES